MSDAPFELVISPRMRTAIRYLRGDEDGDAWLDDLPRRIADACARWDVRPRAVADDGAMSCCVFVETPDGEAAVVKIPHEPAAGRSEARALTHWSPASGTPAVMAADHLTGEVLMERIQPGTTAYPAPGPESSRSLLDLIDRLQAAGPGRDVTEVQLESIVSMRLDWAEERFTALACTEGLELVDAARGVARGLLATAGPSVLLHGDLQPKNILVGEGDLWYAIDPFACHGEVAADVAFWCVMQDSPTSVADRLAQTQVPERSQERTRAWAQVFALAELRPHLVTWAERQARYLAHLGALGDLKADDVEVRLRAVLATVKAR